MKNIHLTLDNRIFIEKCLDQGKSIHQIAVNLGKSDSSIAREIQRNRYKMPVKQTNYYPCIHRLSMCGVMHLCDADCNRFCNGCVGYCSTGKCKDYIPEQCKCIKSVPYVCNACENVNRTYCNYPRYRYSASMAHQLSMDRARDCREGISLSPGELEEIDAIVSPLILKGQSVRSVFRRYQDKLPCSERTLYNLIDKQVLTARNIDLQRRVRYKPRYAHKKRTTIESDYLIGRRYKDFDEYVKSNPTVSVVEMDTVIGMRNTKKVLLTLIFRSCHFMIAILLPDKSQNSVKNAFDELYEVFGHDRFKKLFGVILTDRGTEFSNPFMFEQDINGNDRTMLYYCDSYSSYQKGMIEKNHEFIRYIIPSGRSLDGYTQEDINLMMNHINNYPRESLNDATPYELAKHLIGTDILRKLHFHKIEADNVILKPILLQNQYRK